MIEANIETEEIEKMAEVTNLNAVNNYLIFASTYSIVTHYSRSSCCSCSLTSSSTTTYTASKRFQGGKMRGT